MTSFLVSFIAGVSEEMLLDIFKAVLLEITVTRKTADFSKTVKHLKEVIDEVAKAEGLSDDEKNTRLADAGRAAVERLRND